LTISNVYCSVNKTPSHSKDSFGASPKGGLDLWSTLDTSRLMALAIMLTIKGATIHSPSLERSLKRRLALQLHLQGNEEGDKPVQEHWGEGRQQ